MSRNRLPNSGLGLVRAAWLTIAALTWTATTSLGAPGLLAVYRDDAGTSITRVDSGVAFHWSNAMPDSRLRAGPFSVSWKGRLATAVPGVYRFRFFGNGSCELWLSGKRILTHRSEKPRWSSVGTLSIDERDQEIEVLYRSEGLPARIGLYWSGPRFLLEPVGERFLSHEAAAPRATEHDRGHDLVRVYRCAACHAIPSESPPLRAPALDKLDGNINRDWLLHHLTATSHGKFEPDRRMPFFALTRDQAIGIGEFLLSLSDKTNPDKDRGRGSAVEGRRVFFTTGCAGCHRVDGVGDDGLFGGGDLTTIARKRPPSFFDLWLADPKKVNADHRMPHIDLTARERRDLSAYLQTLTKEGRLEGKWGGQPGIVSQGKRLAANLRCAACHRIPGLSRPRLIPLPNTALGETDAACFGKPGRDRPGYVMSAEDVAAIQGYLRGRLAARRQPPQAIKLDGARILRENNCLGCHARGTSFGFAAKIPEILEAHPSLAPALRAATPPALEGIGDKFHDDVLQQAVRGRLPKRRPWLSIRMPRFDFDESTTSELVRYFRMKDRVPDTGKTPPRIAAATLTAAGRRLVSAGGFNCASCHQIGKARPKNVGPDALGPDLTLLGKQLRREWFLRFVRDPARTGLRAEMPALVVPVSGVLNDRLDLQLEAVWHVLNQRGFTPSRQLLIRTVGQPHDEQSPHAIVFTDVFRAGTRVLVKPFVIALPNRHTLLFDLETGELIGWWIGDAARQWTEGKTWFWEPAGTNVFPIAAMGPELEMMVDGKAILPERRGQFVTEFDSYHHRNGGVLLTHRLHFRLKANGPPVVVRVRQEFYPRKSGFERRIQVVGTPDGWLPRLRIWPTVDFVRNGDSAAAKGAVPKYQVQLSRSKDGGRLSESGQRLHAYFDRTSQVTLQYRANIQEEGVNRVAAKIDRASMRRLPVVPGFEARQLPLPRNIMPTALAWTPGGTLVIASLDGRVWLGDDSDGDGLEDRCRLFSDELAAPYGLLPRSNGSIDVLTKYALLRLTDRDGDGRADDVQTLASGWGHTDDYHDWAVGPVVGKDRNLYVALPCRQNKRTPAAAHLRGTLVQLRPRMPTPEDPRQYSLHAWCGGLRFPMGLAVNRTGDIFATDNQGNYNPFNELNHLQPGKHYGFLNKFEAKRGKRPPLEPPAINIPHPWTRSVNGIAFLYSPKANSFGPFEGHLIGCEYNRRALIRMTLERVEGVYQGACYPFSRFDLQGEENFEGPICCAVSPKGDLYVGSMHDSGWRGGRNTGSIVRLRREGPPPLGMVEMRARSDGFELLFSQPIDPRKAADRRNFELSSFRRISTPAYGGPDRDRRTERIDRIVVSSDGKQVRLILPELRPGFVYELHVGPIGPKGRRPFPSEAYYTLRRIPR